jgi:hypothetical protein
VSGDRAALRGGLTYCLKVFVAVRVGVSVIALMGIGLLPGIKPVGVPGWPAAPITPGWHNLVTVWERFDALWFLRIASHGYANGDGSAAFFPLYPLLVRWVSAVSGGRPLAAAIVVSNLSFLGALMMLYVLSRTELSEETARRAVLYVAIFPTAFFFFAPYSESTFFLLAVITLWAARRQRWAIAAVAGALAALTRSLGVVLALPLIVEAVHQWSESGRRGRPVAVLSSLGPPAGLLVYLWYWRIKSGDWLAPIHQQTGWQREAMNPLVALWHGSLDAYRFVGIYPGGYHELDWLIVIPALVAAAYALRRFRPAFGIYTWVSILVPLCLVFDGRPLMSDPRFLLPLFPLMWAVAVWTQGHPVRQEIYLAGSAALMGLMLLLFVNWYYVF